MYIEIVRVCLGVCMCMCMCVCRESGYVLMCVHTAVYGYPCQCICISVGGSQMSIAGVFIDLHLPYLLRQALIAPKAYQFIWSVSFKSPCLHPFISTWTTYVLSVAGILQGTEDPSSGPQV